MALKQGASYFCKWLHFENGRLTHRRLHVLEIQARDGRMYSVTGDKLPEALVTSTGDKVQGQHVAQILLRPGKCFTPQAEWKVMKPPPTARDLVFMSIGVFLYKGIAFFLDAILRLF